MTRREFDENVNDFQELIDICFLYGFDCCDDVYQKTDAYDMVMDHLTTLRSPREALEYLLYFDMNCDWYLVTAQGLEDADPHFARFKNLVGNAMTEDHYWDEDEHAAAEAAAEATIDDLIMENAANEDDLWTDDLRYEYVPYTGGAEYHTRTMTLHRDENGYRLTTEEQAALREEMVAAAMEDTEEVEDIDLDGFADLIGA